jgi:hypothetical protein
MKDGNILLKTQQASYYTDQLIVLMFLHIYHLFFKKLMAIILVFFPFCVQQKDYLKYSQRQTLLEWLSWIDLQKGQLVQLAAHKNA